MTVVKALSKYRLDTLGVQEVRWNRGGTEPACESIRYRFCVHEGIMSADKRVEFVTDRMAYIALSCHWCGITVLNIRLNPSLSNSFYAALHSNSFSLAFAVTR
jgi:hypothetical protein